MIELTPEQQKAYDRYIVARNKIGMVRVRNTKRNKWVPLSDYSACVDIAGLNHPLFVFNDEWHEYKTAFLAWLEIEPKFREQERMRMSRGDYGSQDSWEERTYHETDSYRKIQGDE